jgi:hypothetical protein
MSVGASGPHLGGDPNCFHELLSRCTLAQRCLGVPLDAVWALCDVRDGYGDDLLGLRGQRAVGSLTILAKASAMPLMSVIIVFETASSAN